MEEFDYEIRFLEGKNNVLADYFSRNLLIRPENTKEIHKKQWIEEISRIQKQSKYIQDAKKNNNLTYTNSHKDPNIFFWFDKEKKIVSFLT